jgi:hypothetical protein
MNRNEDTRNPKNPPQSLMHPEFRNLALWSFVGSLAIFFVLVGVAFLFWTVAHPRPAAREGMENVVGPSGYYSTEGGHNPDRYFRARDTQGELKFRGLTTPPRAARDR